MIKQLTSGRTVELWLCGIALLSAAYTALTFGAYEEHEHIGEILGTFGTLVIVAAVYCRYFTARTIAANKRLSRGRVRRPFLIILLPAMVTVVMSPVILTGGLDPEMSGLKSMFLFVLLGYACLPMGMLAAFLVLWPLEGIGRGILRVLTGKPDGGWLILLGAAGLLVISFGIVGALALDDLPSAWRARGQIMRALLGIDGQYRVVSPILLWVARLLGLVLLTIILAAVGLGRSDRGGQESLRR